MKLEGFFPDSYELIDCGGGAKLERWGDVVTIRPEHQAYFKPILPIKKWKEIAHWEFTASDSQSIQGIWKKLKEEAPDQWIFTHHELSFHLEIKTNKHIGIFPEQACNWQSILEDLSERKRFLNCFAYTGIASLFGQRTGAEVTHCDSSKTANEWAKKNAVLNGIATIKWLTEDAFSFIQKEVKRGNKYDLIQLDPPAFGISANKATWKLESLLEPILETCKKALTPTGKIILNTYSPKISTETLEKMRVKGAWKGESKELYLTSTSGKRLYFGILSSWY